MRYCFQQVNWTLDPNLVRISDQLHVRLRNSSVGFDAKGNYPDSGVFTTSLLSASGMKGITTFVPIERYYSSVYALYSTGVYGTVKYRVSVDSGVTWKWFDGVNWSTASLDSHWNTKEIVDQNISNLQIPFPGAVKFSGKIYSGSNGVYTPYVSGIVVVYDCDYNPLMDVYSSIKAFLEANYVSQFIAIQDLDSDSSTIDLITDFTLHSVTSVYNLTTDPGKLNNLYQSYSGRVITLKSEQASGSSLEIVFTATCPIVVRRDPELETSQIPHLICSVSSITPSKETQSKAGQDIITYPGRSTATITTGNSLRDVPVRLVVVCENAVVSMQMFNSLDALLQTIGSFTSVTTGKSLPIKSVTPMDSLDNLSLPLFAKAISIVLSVPGGSESVSMNEIPTVQTIQIRVRKPNQPTEVFQ